MQLWAVSGKLRTKRIWIKGYFCADSVFLSLVLCHSWFYRVLWFSRYWGLSGTKCYNHKSWWLMCLSSRQERKLNQRLCTRIIIHENRKWDRSNPICLLIFRGYMTFCPALIATTSPHIIPMSQRLEHFLSSLKMLSYKEQPIVIHTLKLWIFLAKRSQPTDSASLLNLHLHSVIQYTNKPGYLRCSLL